MPHGTRRSKLDENLSCLMSGGRAWSEVAGLSSVAAVGVDACTTGWIAVALGEGALAEAHQSPT